MQKVTVDNVTETRGMIYYIGFWLPTALVGKLFSLHAGYLVWALLPIYLIGNISALKVNSTLSSDVYSTTGFVFLVSFFFID